MAEIQRDYQNSASDLLHPWLYRVVAVLVTSFGLAALSIAAAGTAGVALAALSLIASLSAVLALILPWQAWYASRRRRMTETEAEPTAMPFKDWAALDFVASSGNLKGAQAAVQLLLPIAAAALGLGGFGLVWHLTTGA